MDEFWIWMNKQKTLDFYKTKGFETVRFSASLSERTCESCRCAFLPVIQEKTILNVEEGWVTGKEQESINKDNPLNLKVQFVPEGEELEPQEINVTK